MSQNHSLTVTSLTISLQRVLSRPVSRSSKDVAFEFCIELGAIVSISLASELCFDASQLGSRQHVLDERCIAVASMRNSFKRTGKGELVSYIWCYHMAPSAQLHTYSL